MLFHHRCHVTSPAVAPPVSAVPPADWPTPTLRRRMACWVYEGMLLFGVVFVAGYLFSALTQTRHALDNRWAQQAFLFLVLGIYFGWFWAKGQTLAMKTWHIRLLDAHGQPVTQARAVWRYVLSWVWFLPPLAVSAWGQLTPGAIAAVCSGWVVLWAALAGLHPTRQFWHDAWAGTRLVQTPLQPAPAKKR